MLYIYLTGGFSFDKHLKDHKADNKEVENVKHHDIGEKFGGEMTKEHKLGKHKEKSKGHKLHGFKNVYHKEEYGDHKTFHDEFLDTDHQHNYDDHHEHQEVEGGKFSKGTKHEGKNFKYDKGDEKHEWGKEDFDVHGEGHHDKGANKSKHRHATKKHQGHYDANAHREKNAVHKIKKGSPAPYVHVHHGGHHGPHQAQIEPIVPHYNPHHEQVDVPSHSYSPPVDTQSHQIPYQGDSHGSNGAHNNHYQSHADHTNNHGNNQYSQNEPYENGHNDDYYAKNGGQADYQERTAQNHRHRSSGKVLDDKSDEKLIAIAKEEPVARKYDPIEQKQEAIERTHEPAPYKPQPIEHTQEHVVQKHEPHSYKHQAHTHNHQPHTHNHQPHAHNHQPHAHNHQSHAHNYQPHAHNHQSRAHKYSLAPNHEIKRHHRKPVYPDNSQFRYSQPAGYEKFSEPFNERFNNHNQGIKYRFQPRNHQQHSHNRRLPHISNTQQHHLQNQQQPLTRSAVLNHHHQTHSHHHQPHHHNSNKNHSHFRHTPSNYQQAYRSDTQVPKSEQMPTKPSRSEDVISQKRYE